MCNVVCRAALASSTNAFLEKVFGREQHNDDVKSKSADSTHAKLSAVSGRPRPLPAFLKANHRTFAHYQVREI